MASGQTQYYGLSQWEAADKVERVDFNSDNARVDGALRALAEQAGQKADRSAVDSLSTRWWSRRLTRPPSRRRRGASPPWRAERPTRRSWPPRSGP